MKEKIVKPFFLQMMGVIITQCTMFNFNPLAIGWFGAMTTIGNSAVVAFPIMGAGLCYSMGYAQGIKYSIVMLTILIVTGIYKKRNADMSSSYAGVISGGSLFMMELADWFMGINPYQLYGEGLVYDNYYQLFVILMLSIAAGSATAMFGMSAHNVMGYLSYNHARDNHLAKQIDQAIINNNQNMMKLANGYKNLSYKIMDMVGTNGENVIECDRIYEQIEGTVCKNCYNCGICWGTKAGTSKDNLMELVDTAGKFGKITKERLPAAMANQCLNQKEMINGVNNLLERARINMVWNSRMEESRLAVAMQLTEMADMVESFVKPDYKPVRITPDIEAYLKNRLREKQVIAKKINISDNRRGLIQIDLTVKAKGSSKVRIKDIMEVLEDYIEHKLILVMGKRSMIEPESLLEREFKNISLIEDANFRALYGVANRAKMQEDVSGDNYAVMEVGNGQMFISICDGMGTGRNANRYSRTVVDLLEQFLKNGFSENTALKLINSMLLVQNQWDSPMALDIGIIDLYSGSCSLAKMGAACTYIKRGNWVECLKSVSLPMGAINMPDVETITKKLYNGDFVIMVSDGVIDGMDAGDKEEMMGRIIMETDTVNPRKMARDILERACNYTGDENRDDMTVIVLGIWDKI